MRPRLGCCGLFWLASAFSINAGEREPKIILHEDFQETGLGNHLVYRIIEPGKPDESWLRLRPGVYTEPKPGTPIELKFTVTNATARQKHLVLVSGEARTDRIKFRLVRFGKPDAFAEGGDMHARNERPQYLSTVFRFELASHETATVFMTVSNPVEIATDFNLLSEESFGSYAAAQYAIQGIFFGAILVLLLYYTVVYIATRSREIAAYLFYLVAITVFMMARTGLLYQLAAFRWPELMNVAVTPLPAVIYSAGIRFARAFLELKKGLLDTGMRTVQYAVLAPVPVAFFSRAISREMCDWLTLVVSPGLLLLAAILWNKTPKARLFLLAWIWPILASLAQYTGIDSSFEIRNTLLQGTMLAEFAFFAVFVGQDIRRKERDRSSQRLRLQSMHEELEEARKVHSTLLPAALPTMENVALSVFYRPMSQLGGDYYDWVRLDENRLVILVADVTGHGLPAAMDAAAVRIAFQSSVGEADSPSGILEAMNRKFMQQNIDRCVSAICVIYSKTESMMHTSLAGHPPAVLVGHGQAKSIGENAQLLGFSAESKFRESTTKLSSGDRLFLATDGVFEVPEAADVDDFGSYSDQLLAETGAPLAEQIERTIQKFDLERKGKQWDDVTLLGIEFR